MFVRVIAIIEWLVTVHGVSERNQSGARSLFVTRDQKTMPNDWKLISQWFQFDVWTIDIIQNGNYLFDECRIMKFVHFGEKGIILRRFAVCLLFSLDIEKSNIAEFE